MSATTIIVLVFALAVLTGVGLVERRSRLDRREERRRGLNRESNAQIEALGAAGQACLSVAIFGFGPNLLFVLTYELAPVPAGDRMYVASSALAIAVLIALLLRLLRPLPNRPTFPWRNLLIIAMAGMTVALHDAFFVQVRPTVTNLIAVLLAMGSLAGLSPRLEGMFNRDSVSLDDAGWRKMVVGSVVLFIEMAAANEYVRRFKSEAFWVHFQLWGPPLFFAAFLIFVFLVIRRNLPAGQCAATPPNQPSEPSNDQ